MTASGRSLHPAWKGAVEAWKGAVGLGTLCWAGYGTVASTVFGHTPGWDGNAAFAVGGLLCAFLAIRGGGVTETQPAVPATP